jgi:acyl carrier protein
MIMNYVRAVREFVTNNFLYGDGASLEDGTSFLESGTVDSTGMLELIMFLETTYQVKVAPEEMIPDNLDSVNRIANFLTRKLDSRESEETAV